MPNKWKQITTSRLYTSAIKKNIKRNAKEHSSNEVREAIQKADIPMEFLQMDNKYWSLPTWIWKNIIEKTKVDRKTYTGDFFDCDDFAVLFRAKCTDTFGVNGVGIVVDYSGGHAYNLILARERGQIAIKWLEPQNDVIMDELGESKLYKGTNGFIFL